MESFTYLCLTIHAFIHLFMNYIKRLNYINWLNQLLNELELGDGESELVPDHF